MFQNPIKEVIDLSHEVSENMENISGWTTAFPMMDTIAKTRQLSGGKVGYAARMILISEHTGTHIDAPRHMLEKGSPIDQMPLGQLVKEGVLINLPNKGPNSVVTVKEIEESGVELGPNRIPIIHTGFTEKTWGKPEFWTQMPYLEAGVGALMASKGVPAVALDVFPEKPLWRGVKLDPGEVWVANHLALFEKGIPLIQFVTNLSQIGTGKFVLVALPLKIKGGDASPARVVALVE